MINKIKLVFFSCIIYLTLVKVNAQILKNGIYQFTEIDNCSEKINLTEKEELFIVINNYSRFRKIFTKIDGTLIFYSKTKKKLVNNELSFKVLFINLSNKDIQLIWPAFLHYSNQLDFIHKELTSWLWESCNSKGTIELIDLITIKFNMNETNNLNQNICYNLIFNKYLRCVEQ